MKRPCQYLVSVRTEAHLRNIAMAPKTKKKLLKKKDTADTSPQLEAATEKKTNANASPKLSAKTSPKLDVKTSPKLAAKGSPKVESQGSPEAGNPLTRKQKKAVRKKAMQEKRKTVPKVEHSPEDKEKLKQEAINLIKESCSKDVKMKPFVPEKWVSKFKPALGAYGKFVKGLTDIFVIDGDVASGKYEIKLKAGKATPKASPKTAPKSSPKASPRPSPKVSPKASPKAGAVKKKNLKKKKGGT